MSDHLPGGLPADRLSELAGEVERDGVCVLPGLLDAALVDGWNERVLELFAERRGIAGGVAPRGPGRFYFTLPFVPPFADASVFAHPAVLGVVRRLLGEDLEMVQLAVDIPVRGSEPQEVHRDHPPLFGDDHPTPLYALAVNIPLVDVTAENGPFEVARGTHRVRRDEGMAAVERGEIPLEQLLLRRGDVMVRTPLALHRGTANATDTPRPMVVFGFVRSWLRTENVDLVVPADVHRALPEDARRLLRCRVVDALTDGAETYVHFSH